VKIATSDISVLIVLPCFNEAENIGKLLRELSSITVHGVSITTLPVNDCSKDNTLPEIKNYSTHYLNLCVNLGIGGAVQSGLLYAHRNNFDIAVQMDGDGQHPPGELSKIIAPILNNTADICIGSRFITKEGFQSTLARRAGIKFLSGLIKLFSGARIHDCTSGYRAFNKKAIELCVEYYPDKYPEPESILYLIKRGLRVMETPVIMRERTGGVSSISSFSSLYYMLKVSLALLFIRIKLISNDKH
jgi:glycosyltransferase involved in cell wall biosynthesis